MRHPRTAEEIGTIHIEQAARATRRPSLSGGDISGDSHLLYVPFARTVPLPEPVATDWLNGRPPGGWVTGFGFCLFPPLDGEFEEAAIRSARERERRAELALLAGTVQP